MNLRVPKMRGISWLSAEPVSFSRRTLLHGVSKQYLAQTNMPCASIMPSCWLINYSSIGHSVIMWAADNVVNKQHKYVICFVLERTQNVSLWNAHWLECPVIIRREKIYTGKNKEKLMPCLIVKLSVPFFTYTSVNHLLTN